MNYMTFADGTRIQIEEGASLDHIVHVAQNEASAIFVCEKCTAENVSHVVFSQPGTDDEILATGEYDNLVLIGAPTRQTNEDGLSVTVTISLREKTEIELRLDAIEVGQEIQDGAIDDLAIALSGEEV